MKREPKRLDIDSVVSGHSAAKRLVLVVDRRAAGFAREVYGGLAGARPAAGVPPRTRACDGGAAASVVFWRGLSRRGSGAAQIDRPSFGLSATASDGAPLRASLSPVS